MKKPVNKLHLSINCSLVLLTVLTVLACQDSYRVQKPDLLIEKEEMMLIVEDMMILDAAKTSSKKPLELNNIQVYNFITSKYKVDSLKLRQNLEYYNLQFSDNLEIYDTIKSRLEAKKARVDSLVKIQDSLKVKNINKSLKLQDSISRKKVLGVTKP